MKKNTPNYIIRIVLVALPLFFSTHAYADMYKYLKADGSTLLTGKRLSGHKLLKVYKIHKTSAYKSSQKREYKTKKYSKSTNWKKGYGKSKKNRKKSKRLYSKRVHQNLVKANGRDNGIIVGCNSPKHLHKKAKTYAKTIQIYSRIYQVDAELIHAIVRQESCFNEGAHSRVGAIGLMQLMPETSLDLGINDPWNPEHNIQGGIKYIAQMLDMFDGNNKLAIAAYNAGPGNVNKYKGIPPFKETRNYVKKVYGEYKRLKAASANKKSLELRVAAR